ncbi:hypothetical protein ANO11243_079880 [Dothideomycetidae sp. 11243]|nr:hypothetical protein ANO11243_079880 [fungal sp. No.11243]
MLLRQHLCTSAVILAAATNAALLRASDSASASASASVAMEQRFIDLMNGPRAEPLVMPLLANADSDESMIAQILARYEFDGLDMANVLSQYPIKAHSDLWEKLCVINSPDLIHLVETHVTNHSCALSPDIYAAAMDGQYLLAEPANTTLTFNSTDMTIGDGTGWYPATVNKSSVPWTFTFSPAAPSGAVVELSFFADIDNSTKMVHMFVEGASTGPSPSDKSTYFGQRSFLTATNHTSIASFGSISAANVAGVFVVKEAADILQQDTMDVASYLQNVTAEVNELQGEANPDTTELENLKESARMASELSQSIALLTPGFQADASGQAAVISSYQAELYARLSDVAASWIHRYKPKTIGKHADALNGTIAAARTATSDAVNKAIESGALTKTMLMTFDHSKVFGGASNNMSSAAKSAWANVLSTADQETRERLAAFITLQFVQKTGLEELEDKNFNFTDYSEALSTTVNQLLNNKAVAALIEQISIEAIANLALKQAKTMIASVKSNATAFEAQVKQDMAKSNQLKTRYEADVQAVEEYKQNTPTADQNAATLAKLESAVHSARQKLQAMAKQERTLYAELAEYEVLEEQLNVDVGRQQKQIAQAKASAHVQVAALSK